MKKKTLVAAIRVDGGKRTDLADQRRRRKALAAVAPPSREDTRVTDAWRRAEMRAAHEAETAPQRRRTSRLKREGGGKEGTRLAKVKVKISAERSERQTIRCRPGTFEWQYGRNKQDVLFHAGSHFAKLWEKAGMTVTSSADYLRGIASGYAQGISETRIAAMDKLLAAHPNLGNIPFNRLVDYCVRGLTTREMAKKYDTEPRAMSHVLHQDLRACAVEFQFLRPGRAA